MLSKTVIRHVNVKNVLDILTSNVSSHLEESSGSWGGAGKSPDSLAEASS